MKWSAWKTVYVGIIASSSYIHGGLKVEMPMEKKKTCCFIYLCYFKFFLAVKKKNLIETLGESKSISSE